MWKVNKPQIANTTLKKYKYIGESRGQHHLTSRLFIKQQQSRKPCTTEKIDDRSKEPQSPGIDPHKWIQLIFYTGTGQSNGERRSFFINDAGTTGHL